MESNTSDMYDWEKDIYIQESFPSYDDSPIAAENSFENDGDSNKENIWEFNNTPRVRRNRVQDWFEVRRPLADITHLFVKDSDDGVFNLDDSVSKNKVKLVKSIR